MKVLLVGEASGVHRNLKKGLLAHGVRAEIGMPTAWPQYPYHDFLFAPNWEGALGGIARNVAPFAKIASMPRFDVINFSNTITSVGGKFSKYLDLPLMRRKGRVLSYYAVGCDEIGLVRHNAELPYRPCATCLASGEQLGRDCEKVFNPIYAKSRERVRRNFDFGASSMMEYSHNADLFPTFSAIRLPIDIEPIAFHPATNQRRTRIIHTPTRRGFKGTDQVLRAINQLGLLRDDFEFRVIEGLSYRAYLEAIRDADIVVDQIYSQSAGMNALELMAAGKIVLTGATELGRKYYHDESASPAFNASPDPAVLAKTLSSILDRKPKFSTLAVRGRRFVEQWHDPALIAGQFISGWNEARARNSRG